MTDRRAPYTPAQLADIARRGRDDVVRGKAMKLIEVPREQTAEERAIINALTRLRRAYEREAQPLVDRLAEIESMYPRKYVAVPDLPEKER